MRKYYWYALKKVTHDSILHTQTTIRKISQEQMAAKLHMSVRSYSYLESGPSCHVTLDREFMAYCDRCGQRLDWEGYRNAKIIFPVRR